VRKYLFGRLLLGFFAVAPLLVIALILSIVFGGVRSPTLPLGKIVIASMLVGMAFYVTSISYFLYIVQTDDRLDSSDKARWTFFLLMFFPFAAVSFWYQFIWRERALQ